MTSSAVSDPAARRRRLANAFGQAADSYDRFRPDYPADAVAAAVDGAHRVLDLGAGTGKLTRLLSAAGARQVWAVEPDRQMLAVLAAATPDAIVLGGSAEQIPLPDAAVEVVVVGQALHWFDLDTAMAEIARVLLPGGRLACLWNNADTRDEFTRRWVQTLNSTVRPDGKATGQTAAAESVPEAPFVGNAYFADPALQLVDWSHRMSADELHGLADTYSWALTAEASAREALHRQLAELIGMRPDVAIAERCQVWTAVRL
ncbi:class I SAM-dependent methyltransferase [Nakamurella sp. A5-74]|uniref:Class I SAM-dependent methyltransferase n=1 Tax=Nakamurella sp. A5-74 TaxID=3158264 RepID=A0AAU8DR15_9ACTN